MSVRCTTSSSSLPPHDLAAEQALLGAMIVNPSAIAAAREHVAAEDFYRTSHGTIYAAILAMDERGESVDTITLASELRRQGSLDEVGGANFIHTIAELCPVAANAPQYARIVLGVARQCVGLTLARRLELAFAEERTGEQRRLARELGELLGVEEGGCLCRQGPHRACDTAPSTRPTVPRDKMGEYLSSSGLPPSAGPDPALR